MSQIGDGTSEVKNPQVPLSAQSLKITTAESLPITTEASPQNGIGGYYYLAEIGEPYFSTLPGQFVDETLQKPSPSALDVEPRPPEHQILRDWTPADLDRLGLSDFSKDLLSKPKKQSGGKNPPDEPGEGGILALLPKQKP